jgi:hypothetical protein
LSHVAVAPASPGEAGAFSWLLPLRPPSAGELQAIIKADQTIRARMVGGLR